MPSLIRTDKFVSEQLGISRTDAKKLISSGSIAVNGSCVTRPEHKLSPEDDIVTRGGKQIVYREHIYIMLNKPQGVICATRDGLSRTVLELIPEEFRRNGIFPAGRLDKDTEGFVFITDDGDTAHRMLSPKSHVSKLYYAELEKEAEDDYITAFEDGLVIDGGEKCLPAKIEICPDRHFVYITLFEGKYHQIKRMAQAVGNNVIYLKRIKIGGITLDERLKPGECREIMHKELAELYTL